MIKQIDLIIPAYKAHKTIFKALCSVAMQTYADRVKVTIVSDADGEKYDDYAWEFGGDLDIKVFYNPVNGGPAVARQFGIDRTKNDYVMFLDADDTLASAYSIETLVKTLEQNEKNVVAVGTFYEKRNDLSFVKHENDLVWLHGKLYKRDFLNKYGIRFNETRANEDCGFNTICHLLSSEEEKFEFTPAIVYYWHFEPTGITRLNNFEYTYNQSFVGYVDNMIYAIEFAESKRPKYEYTKFWAIQVMAQLYVYYLRTYHNKPEFAEQNLAKSKEFANRIFVNYVSVNGEDDKTVEGITSQVIEEQIMNLRGIVPHLTYNQFIYECLT